MAMVRGSFALSRAGAAPSQRLAHDARRTRAVDDTGSTRLKRSPAVAVPAAPPAPTPPPSPEPAAWVAAGLGRGPPGVPSPHFLAAAPRSGAGQDGSLCQCSDARARCAAFLETDFTPYAVTNPDSSAEGTTPATTSPCVAADGKPPSIAFPFTARPDDLLLVDLGEAYPELKNLRLRGRIDGRRVVPYYTREDIEAGKGGVTGHEILWVDDAVDLFFLQIQGSGRVVLDGGEVVRVGYADQRPSLSFGRAPAGRARRADAGPGVDAGHQGLG